MAKRIPVVCCGTNWGTKKNLEAECKRRLGAYLPDDVVPLTSEDARWFLQLIEERHPEVAQLLSRDANGVELYRRDGQWSNHLRIRYTNGEMSPFSWKCCVTGRPKTAKEAASSAMRAAVAYQAIEAKSLAFLERLLVECPMSGELVGADDAEVHHVVEFSVLRDAWLSRGGLAIEDIVVCDSRNGGREMACPAQIASWVAYHEEHAELVVVCKKWHGEHTRESRKVARNGREKTEDCRATTEPKLHTA